MMRTGITTQRPISLDIALVSSASTRAVVGVNGVPSDTIWSYTTSTVSTGRTTSIASPAQLFAILRNDVHAMASVLRASIGKPNVRGTGGTEMGSLAVTPMRVGIGACVSRRRLTGHQLLTG